jgi:diguanylate cyclase (GGDEF)-like protein/putative nucleotidyltransferase with HDIG domain
MNGKRVAPLDRANTQSMNPTSPKARLYIAITLLMGFASLLTGVLQSGEWVDMSRFLCCLVLALLASGMKVSLPGVTGTMSVIFLFILIGIHELTLAQTILMGLLGALIQCYWKSKNRPRPIQVAFNLASMTSAVTATYYVFHLKLGRFTADNELLMLVAAASTFFVLNTAPVACVISLTEQKSLRKVWSECYFWSFPYYLLGAAVAGIVGFVDKKMGWQSSLLVLPVVYLIFRSYRLYLARLEAERNHAQDVASLHLRTIEALALAIEAKDHNTHEHLNRVQIYALAIGKELALSEPEQEALRAAAVLHDIGKLAVPEHIISKPGRLTPEEFDRMKIHPIVGAEILERVQFPYPVVPIVRAHHERCDGSGYPDGLRGDQIPIGARILSVVDCLDGLASDRQYRPALSLDDAMKYVVGEASKSFDPRVVEVLQRRHKELELLAKATGGARTKLSKDIKIENGKAPGAGFEAGDAGPITPGSSSVDFLTSIAAARHEVQMLFELTQELGNSLSLDETLSMLAARLKHLIPYDSIAIYCLRNNQLIPEHVSGDNFRLLSSLRIRLGEGISGWVAENRKPIVNGNLAAECSRLNDPTNYLNLRSVLTVPLEGVDGVVGVLALYRTGADAFTRDHLRILQAITSKIALSFENALKYRQVERSATTDYLTSLPNARSLFVQLDSELARCRRHQMSLAVLVCDLDGFKQVNDRFGHLQGNRLLTSFASKLKQTCREYDYVARMGGDEFVLVLPGLKPEALEDKLKHLRTLAAEAGHEISGKDLLSVSVGHAFYPEEGADAEQLLSEADRRMYAQKRKNHNELYTHPLTAFDERAIGAIH